MKGKVGGDKNPQLWVNWVQLIDHRFRSPWEEKDPPGFFVISLQMTRIDVNGDMHPMHACLGFLHILET